MLPLAQWRGTTRHAIAVSHGVADARVPKNDRDAPRSDKRAARPHTVRDLRRTSATSRRLPDLASSGVVSPPVGASIRPFVFHGRFNLCEQGNCGCGRSEQR